MYGQYERMAYFLLLAYALFPYVVGYVKNVKKKTRKQKFTLKNSTKRGSQFLAATPRACLSTIRSTLSTSCNNTITTIQMTIRRIINYIQLVSILIERETATSTYPVGLFSFILSFCLFITFNIRCRVHACTIAALLQRLMIYYGASKQFRYVRFCVYSTPIYART